MSRTQIRVSYMLTHQVLEESCILFTVYYLLMYDYEFFQVTVTGVWACGWMHVVRAARRFFCLGSWPLSVLFSCTEDV